MFKYTIKRICYMIITLFAVATITFFLMRSIPGDPLASMARTLPEQTKANYYDKIRIGSAIVHPISYVYERTCTF